MISNYYEKQWFSVSDKRESLPRVLNIAALYHAILRSFISVPAPDDLRKEIREANDFAVAGLAD